MNLKRLHNKVYRKYKPLSTKEAKFIKDNMDQLDLDLCLLIIEQNIRLLKLERQLIKLHLAAIDVL